MQSITKIYLLEIIYRNINETINLYRASKKTEYDLEPTATEDEILDFICSIPYFDERLKNFLLGNLPEQNIIISQQWEIEFIKQCTLWSESFEWLHGDNSFLSDVHLDSLKIDRTLLTLPY
jgi:hypothetical protein